MSGTFKDCINGQKAVFR